MSNPVKISPEDRDTLDPEFKKQIWGKLERKSIQEVEGFPFDRHEDFVKAVKKGEASIGIHYWAAYSWVHKTKSKLAYALIICLGSLNFFVPIGTIALSIYLKEWSVLLALVSNLIGVALSSPYNKWHKLGFALGLGAFAWLLIRANVLNPISWGLISFLFSFSTLTFIRRISWKWAKEKVLSSESFAAYLFITKNLFIKNTSTGETASFDEDAERARPKQKPAIENPFPNGLPSHRTGGQSEYDADFYDPDPSKPQVRDLMIVFGPPGPEEMKNQVSEKARNTEERQDKVWVDLVHSIVSSMRKNEKEHGNTNSFDRLLSDLLKIQVKVSDPFLTYYFEKDTYSPAIQIEFKKITVAKDQEESLNEAIIQSKDALGNAFGYLFKTDWIRVMLTYES